MIFARGHRPARFATGVERLSKRGLNRRARGPNLLFLTTRSRVNALTELAKKPLSFPTMLLSDFSGPPKWVASLPWPMTARCMQLKKKVAEHGQ